MKDRFAPRDARAGVGAAAGVGMDAAGMGMDAAGVGMDTVEHPLAFAPDAGRAVFSVVQHRSIQLLASPACSRVSPHWLQSTG